ncbi:bifunctional proline dehydrogenase/L-glutamate gamma-semialdehyde dehydrogenase [Brachybacterium sp. DNPG3]
MPSRQNPGRDELLSTRLTIEDIAEQVRIWIAAAASRPVPPPARLLSEMLRDPRGLEFAVAFVDRVIRPEDPQAAAIELRRLAQDPPAFLPPGLRRVMALGGTASALAPQVVVPAAQRVMRETVSHLILDARPKPLGAAIARLTADGTRLNLNLLGEAVLGAQEAARRLQGVRELIAREDVDYVSIKVSSVVDHLPLWAAAETVDHIVDTLLPLYVDASRGPHPTFLTMDMEEYRDLELTLQVFERLLSRPELAGYRAGLVLQAYLPDAPRALERLRAFAERRVGAGGAPIKVRLVKGANLPMEKVEAALHGWRQAPLETKEETDAQYKRLVLSALDPAALEAVHIGVAGHNLFDIAFAHLLMRERGIRPGRGSGVEFEMLAGMAPGQQAVVREATGTMRLYVPVVAPAHFDVAVSYLVRRLEEGASPENFLSALFDLDERPDLVDRERNRFARSLDRALRERSVPTHRDQDRAAEGRGGLPELGSGTLPTVPGRFRSTPDTDLSVPANQQWAAALAHRLRGSRLGLAEADAARVVAREQVDAAISAARAAQGTWEELGAERRGAVLRRVARTLAAHRADLLEVMASETGKTLAQSDPEVSEAIDFCLYYAEQAEVLSRRRDVRFRSRPLTLVAPPWNFPVAIPNGGVMAALAAGGAVVLKPAPQARRCGALLGRLLHEAGVPAGVLQVLDVPEDEIGRALITDERIDQLILTGAFETAALFASWRPELRILAETSGKNAIVVTPSADLDLAVRDVVASAFGHAGQKCSAASLVILVGSVARSRRFDAQLADAVLSLHVGPPTDPTAQMGPVVEEPGPKLRAGLSDLGPGESWLTAPEPLDGTGRLFSPGVRVGVREGSDFHRTEHFGPVLGIMRAATLEDAVRMQNGTGYGLTAGLHSLDPEEIAWWTQHVEAGNLYVNRGITGAVVERQPFGGWKRSAVGPTAKAGGPGYLVRLMRAEDPEELQGADDEAWLAAARHGDREAMLADFGPRDVQDLHGEIDVLRHLPLPVLVRAAADARPVHLRRVLHAAATAGAPVEISVATAELERTALAAGAAPADVRREDDASFADAFAGIAQERVRLIGTVGTALARAHSRRIEVALFADPVVASGRVELAAFLREQAISATAHRYGTPLPHPLDLTGGAGYQRGPR